MILPAIDMSLAFDGNLALALSPFNWARIMGAFGLAYLAPVAINLLLGLTIVLASVYTAALPCWSALPLFGFAYSWLIVLAFHLMGVLIHQRLDQQFGMATGSAETGPELSRVTPTTSWSRRHARKPSTTPWLPCTGLPSVCANGWHRPPSISATANCCSGRACATTC
ncbi:hypothetical protein RLIN73S_04956 [Rhodanobacter lindaniclasticus]